jgi:hypothetical protein
VDSILNVVLHVGSPMVLAVSSLTSLSPMPGPARHLWYRAPWPRPACLP